VPCGACVRIGNGPCGSKTPDELVQSCVGVGRLALTNCRITARLESAPESSLESSFCFLLLLKSEAVNAVESAVLLKTSDSLCGWMISEQRKQKLYQFLHPVIDKVYIYAQSKECSVNVFPLECKDPSTVGSVGSVGGHCFL